MEITAGFYAGAGYDWLWIAFKMVISDGNHSKHFLTTQQGAVVNCFQNGNFRWKSQQKGVATIVGVVVNCFQNGNFRWKSQPFNKYLSIICRLWIAFKIVPSLGNHSFNICTFLKTMLWIAFKIVPSLGNHSRENAGKQWHYVVNCFQNSTFLRKSQQPVREAVVNLSCELLSK